MAATRGVWRAAALAIAAAFAWPTTGDVIKTRDGREFVGVIVSETSATVVIDTIVANIRSKVTLRRGEIASLERGPVPDGFFEPARPAAPRDRGGATRPATTPRRTDPAPARGAAMALEIPIEGVFGEDIIPLGVANALDKAARRGVEHIVFRINSNGGYVWAAEDIARIMDERAGDFTYHALIEKAVSASIWVALSCDTMHMTPDASIGAAVVFSQDETTGDAEVDAKMNSAIAANLAARAEAHGFSGDVVRAMVIGDAELWSWTNNAGEVRVGAERPSGARDAQRLDSRETVLTLTAQQAARIGFAQPVAEPTLDALAEALGDGVWRGAGTTGRVEMERARARAEPVFKKFRLLIDEINAGIARAKDADPRAYQYTIDYGGNLTDKSRRDWERRTDEAIRHWNRVRAALVELERLERDREALKMSRWIETVNIQSLFDQVTEHVDRLTRERDQR